MYSIEFDIAIMLSFILILLEFKTGYLQLYLINYIFSVVTSCTIEKYINIRVEIFI